MWLLFNARGSIARTGRCFLLSGLLGVDGPDALDPIGSKGNLLLSKRGPKRGNLLVSGLKWGSVQLRAFTVTLIFWLAWNGDSRNTNRTILESLLKANPSQEFFVPKKRRRNSSRTRLSG